MVKTLRILQSGPGGGFVVQALEIFKVEGSKLTEEEAAALVEEISARNERLGITTSVVRV